MYVTHFFCFHNNIVHACVPTAHNVHDTSLSAPSEFLTLVS